jgi:hypothetical protein
MCYNKQILESDNEVKAVWKTVKKETGRVSTEVAPSTKNSKLIAHSFNSYLLTITEKKGQRHQNLNDKRRNKVPY